VAKSTADAIKKYHFSLTSVELKYQSSLFFSGKPKNFHHPRHGTSQAFLFHTIQAAFFSGL
jgi:hypothetical protein